MVSYILDSLTLVVSLVVLILNILFSKRENSRKLLVENVIHQRNFDMLELRNQTAQLSTLSDINIVLRRIKDNNYLEELIHCSKEINHILKRQYSEDKKILIIKECLISQIIEFYNNNDNNSLYEISKLNTIFGKITELYVFCAWQCIKIQGTGERRLGSTDFGNLFIKYQKSYLNAEDIEFIDSLNNLNDKV